MSGKAAIGLVLAAVLSAVSQPIPAEGDSLTVLTINVWSGLDYRGSLKMGEYEEKLAFIQRVAGSSPAILLGDFNALADSEEIGLLRQAGFLHVFELAGSGEGFTWDADGNPNIQLQRRAYPDEVPEDPRNKRIDYIFVRGSGLRVTGARVVLDRPLNGQYPSDHYGVLAEIEVR